MLSFNNTINLITKLVERSELSGNRYEYAHLRALAQHMINELRADLDERGYRRESDDQAIALVQAMLDGEA